MERKSNKRWAPGRNLLMVTHHGQVSRSAPSSWSLSAHQEPSLTDTPTRPGGQPVTIPPILNKIQTYLLPFWDSSAFLGTVGLHDIDRIYFRVT